MILTVLAILLAMFGASATLNEAVLAWGGGMWQLLELAMQFSIAMIAAHACVSSPRVFTLLDWLATLPNKERPRQAIVLIATYSMGIAYLNWALSLVASALFVPFVARRNPKTDIRVMIAAAYLGVGTVWHGGLSGSAPLILATPGNPLLEPGSGEPVIDRLIPVTESLFNSFNLTYVVVIFLVALTTVVALHPRGNPQTMTEEQLDRIMPSLPVPDDKKSPAARMEAFPGWVILAAILIGYPLGHSIVTRGFGASWTINAYNAVFLVAALLLQWRPSNLVRAFANGARTASGVILQFSVLRRHLRRHQQHGAGRLAGWPVRAVCHDRQLSSGGLFLLWVHEPVRAISRLEVADRSSVSAPGREGARRVRHDNGARLCVWRLNDESDPAVLGDSNPDRHGAAVRRRPRLHRDHRSRLHDHKRDRDVDHSDYALTSCRRTYGRIPPWW